MRRAIILLAFSVLLSASPAFGAEQEYDIVVYGGTSGGIAAAVQAAITNGTITSP